jgi:hypothetical protein
MTIENPDQPNTTATDWLKTVATYDREFNKWQERSEKIIRRYKADSMTDKGYNLAKFNILWSNVQTALPATFSRLPKPDVSRRFKDTDPVGRVAALILERALNYELEHYCDYRACMNEAVLDRFLGGRGTAWVRYEPHIVSKQLDLPVNGVQATEDIDDPVTYEVIENEESPCDYVHWRDFGHSVARTWEEVTCVWRKIYMTRQACIERFGEELGSQIPLDTKPKELKSNTGDGEEYEALIYEIWDKPTRKAVWISKSMNKVLDERDDPLELENFWPCPRPLYASLTTDSLVPIPDFSMYQDQANTLDIIADRIEGLIKGMQVKGVYNAAEPTLARLFTEGESGTLLPVTNWAAFAEKNGLQGAVNLIDLAPLATTINELYAAAEREKQNIYEITGLADIIRGQSDPNETAAAQKMKGNFGSMRLRAMQKTVAEFASELLQIKAQIICKHYQPGTIAKIGGAQEMSQVDQQLVPQALQLLKNADMVGFRIDIEADSMVELDQQQEKQDRVEFLTAASQFLEKASIVGQQTPQLAPLLMEMLKFGVTGFPIGKTLEGQFDETAEQLKQAAKQPKQDPEAIKAQANMQAEQAKMQMQAQTDQQRMQMEYQAKQIDAQISMQMEQHKQQMQAAQIQHQNEVEAQRSQLEAQHQYQLEQQKMANEERFKTMEQQFQLLMTQLNNQNKLEVAEIGANTTLQAAQISAAQQGSQQ